MNAVFSVIIRASVYLERRTTYFGHRIAIGAAQMISFLVFFVDPGPNLRLNWRNLVSDGARLANEYGVRFVLAALMRELEERLRATARKSPARYKRNGLEVRYRFPQNVVTPTGAVLSPRPSDDTDYALAAPFAFSAPVKRNTALAVIIHAYYPEALLSILTKVRRISGRVSLFISTDREDKREAIEALISEWRNGETDVRIVPNRGRDVSAKWIGFADVYEKHEFFLHLHTKKSLHGGEPLSKWGDYLVESLIGTAEIVDSVLTLFADPHVGVVFPQHFLLVRGVIHWGHNYVLSREFMARAGVRIDSELPLEFPSGSMFWGRSAAFKPLLDMALNFSDFPVEDGQLDGTLSHALERCVLLIAEAAGFEWRKIACADLYPLFKTLLPVQDPTDLIRYRQSVFRPCLVPIDNSLPSCEMYLNEARPISPFPSRNEVPRLNLIIPTVNPRQTFGGVATAIKLFTAWAEHLGPEFDRRIIVTDSNIDEEGSRAFPSYRATLLSGGDGDSHRRLLVDAYERERGQLELRPNDVFLATAWWTATMTESLQRFQHQFFGKSCPSIYLIQDDEPNFYGWGSKYAMAEDTYRCSSWIAVINSEELYRVITAKYKFSRSYFLPYIINNEISKNIKPRPRERIILVYGRPSVLRNAFELICASLRLWHKRDPTRSSRWTTVFLGEMFSAYHLHPLQNVIIEGKVSLERYADYLNRASVGVSLMISPHPSYPPLEMAEAGLATVVNRFPGKDLRERFPDIVSVDRLTPDSLAVALEEAVERMEPEIGRPGRRGIAYAPPPPGPEANPGTLAAAIRGAIGLSI